MNFMKWTILTIVIAVAFAACSKEDDLQQQTNTGNNNNPPVRLSEVVFYSDSSFSGTGTDSVAYQLNYNGNAISKMIKVRQHPAAGGVSLYENYADSILFFYFGTRLIQKAVYKTGVLKKLYMYSYTANILMTESEQVYGSGGYSGTRAQYYIGLDRNHDYGVFTNNFKDSTFYNYNSSGDMNQNNGFYNYGTGWSYYAYSLTYTSQANALRTLINNDVLLSSMLGGDPGVQPSAFVPDSLTMTNGSTTFYKRKVVQQIHSSGYIQRMINYYNRSFMRLANDAMKLPYVQLKYDNL